VGGWERNWPRWWQLNIVIIPWPFQHMFIK
jgi:hypothetical protein